MTHSTDSGQAADTLSDRELCLRLAERLGWPLDVGLIEIPSLGGATYPEALLLPAGAFAVLEAMRERRFKRNVLDDEVYFVRDWRECGGPVLIAGRSTHADLARAIAEAALAALETT